MGRWARRPKPAKLAQCERLREVVEAKLAKRWSPQQIAGWLRVNHPDDPSMWVSHETYLSLFVQSRGALRKELFQYLRTPRAQRRPLGYTVMNGQGQLRNTVHISERPAEANDRAVPGHWEGDLLCGKAGTAIATLVERKTRFAMLVALPNGHSADVVTDALAAAITTLPVQLRRSLTWDHGKEMAEHARFSVASVSPSISVTRAARGSAAPTRTPTDCSASTSPSAATSPRSPNATSTTSPPSSTNDLDQTLGWMSPSQALNQLLH